MNEQIEAGDFVRFHAGKDEWSVLRVTLRNYRISFGKVVVVVNKSDVALYRKHKPLSLEQKYGKIREALELIRLGDWSAISGAKYAGLFAEEVLIAVGELEGEEHE